MLAIPLVARAALLVSLTSAPALAQSTQTPPVTQTTTPPAPSPQTSTPATQSSDDTVSMPVDLSRIKSRLDRPPALVNISEGRVRFYVETVAKQQTFKDYVGDRDLLHGPVKGAQMTHQDFMDMVTPKLLNSSAGFTATETLQAALFNWVVQSAVKKGAAALRNARDEAEVRAIRAQIDREIAALRGGGGN